MIEQTNIDKIKENLNWLSEVTQWGYNNNKFDDIDTIQDLLNTLLNNIKSLNVISSHKEEQMKHIEEQQKNLLKRKDFFNSITTDTEINE